MRGAGRLEDLGQRKQIIRNRSLECLKYMLFRVAGVLKVPPETMSENYWRKRVQ